MRIALFVSDHGWGHLSRSLITAAEAIRRGHALAVVCSPAMIGTVRAALPQATPIAGRLDQGYVFMRGGSPDREATRPLLEAIAEGPQPALIDEVVRWAPEVVIADATPWAADVAHRAGARAALCSNFSWDDQFAAMYGEGAPVAALRGQVRAFDLALELPLGPGLPAVTRRQAVPLLSRWPGTGLPPALAGGDAFATWAMGRTDPAAQPLDLLRALGERCAARGLRLAVNEAVAAHAGPAAVALPDDTSWPDVLAGSRVVVTKAGYSTISETLRGSGHLVVLGVTGLPEERAMMTGIAAMGRAESIPVTAPEFVAAAVAAFERALDRPPAPPEGARGEIAIVDALEALAREG